MTLSRSFFLKAVTVFTLCLTIHLNGHETDVNLQKDLFTLRYSGYSFDPSKEVSKETLKKLLEAARLTPSSYNEEPWVFLIFNKTTDPKGYEKALSTLVDENQKWAKNAPLLIIGVASTKSSRNGQPNRFAEYDTGAAAFSIVLKATELGLMAHQMGGYDPTKAKELFSIPENYVPMAAIAIGYPDLNETKSEKPRKALTENFFEGTWGKGFQ